MIKSHEDAPMCWAATLRLWDVSQREIARRAGYTEVYLSKMLQGHHVLPKTTHQRLAKAFHECLNERPMAA